MHCGPPGLHAMCCGGVRRLAYLPFVVVEPCHIRSYPQWLFDSFDSFDSMKLTRSENCIQVGYLSGLGCHWPLEKAWTACNVCKAEADAAELDEVSSIPFDIFLLVKLSPFLWTGFSVFWDMALSEKEVKQQSNIVSGNTRRPFLNMYCSAVPMIFNCLTSGDFTGHFPSPGMRTIIWRLRPC